MGIKKYSFRSDYCELAHPKVLEALANVGRAQLDSYGLDEFSLRAGELVKTKINAPSADVHFIAGGTLTNLVLISSALRPFEAVVAPESGHIFVHETGAIEAIGHKVCVMRGEGGKLRATDIEAVVVEHCDEHMVKPRLVYISLSAESGAIYTKEELLEISRCCRKNNLYLYIDGARLGAAMNSPFVDLKYEDIANMADAFYVGGTKNGALFGEALVILNNGLKADFRFHLKQKGALLAKGAAIGVQFEALLRDGLYDELASNAVAMGLKLADGIGELGYGFLYPPVTNLLIPIFPLGVADKLHMIYDFYDWQNLGDMTAARMLTSWATPEEMIDGFIADLKNIG
ncbi:MAG: beta-eliminating lyase-related protein [Oscillospiraceae bacterium]|nr:beta-eliminating lyase-related protein [Oscillospiraceae bacterium]